MAVSDRRYRPYEGTLTAPGSRWLVLVRFAWREIFRSRLFSLFFVLCFLYPLLIAALVYLHHNLRLIQFDLPGAQRFFQQLVEQVPIDARLFAFMLRFQTSLALLVVLAAAPAVIAPDLRNNGLALYLSRPLSRAEYTWGKLVALLWPVSLITWIAALAIFALQASLAGRQWLGANLRLGAALVVGGLIWACTVALLGLTIAAWVKWRPIARMVLLIALFMPVAFAGVVQETLGSWWGELVSPSHLIRRVWEGLFGLPPHSELPLAAAWGMLLFGCALCLLLLSRRIRAYEVVR
jgi:ABC-2 type transport system permease protein